MHWTASVTLLILSLLLLANIYVGINYHKLIRKEKKKPLIIIYWTLHITFALGLVLNFVLFFSGMNFGNVSVVIQYIAGLTAGFFAYSIVFFLIKDVFKILGKVIPYPHFSKKIGRALIRGGVVISLLSVMFTVYGFINAKNFKVVDYDITLSKKSSTLDKLHVEFISDAHLGASINASDLQKIVDKINAENPDMVLLGGDFFDDGTTDELKAQASEILKGLKTVYGSYYVVGNHEAYLEDHLAEEKYFTNAGVNIINDKVVTVEDKFILVGRKDKTGGERESFNALMKDVNTSSLPVIVIDHEPSYSDMEAVNFENADLQLSGHTHAGQIIPMNFIDFLNIAPAYGTYETGKLQTLVSAGIGTWAVPIKIGSPSEIMSVRISFV